MSKPHERVRVNVRTFANMASVREEKRNGRDVIIVPSATLPDDVIMNGVKYPAEEIEASYAGLNRTPAPLGHPKVNNQFISARDPEGINLGWVGAWNENVRRENGRVFLDKVIDKVRANECEGGRAILAAIKAGGPIHTSTGLFANMEPAEKGSDYEFVARNIDFDHDAILLGEEGAATPEQGVGMLVNSKGEFEHIKVINSVLDDAERDLGWAVESAVRAVERMERAPLIDRIMSAIKATVMGSEVQQVESSTIERNMDMDKEQLNELSAKVDALTEANEKIGETIATAVAEAFKTNEAEKAKADHTALVNKVVEAKIDGFGQDIAERMDATALNALLNIQSKKPAAPLVGGFAINSNDENDFSPLTLVKGAN